MILVTEIKGWARSWWCQGVGLAVLALLIAAVAFRDHHSLLFWAATLFVAYHSVDTLLRYRRERRHRGHAEVTDHLWSSPVAPAASSTNGHRNGHHNGHRNGSSFLPAPANSLIPLAVPPVLPSQQTKNTP